MGSNHERSTHVSAAICIDRCVLSTVVAGLVLLAVSLGVARADTVDGTVTTLLSGHQDPRDGKVYTVVPAYEMVSMVGEFRAPHLDELRVAIGGWGVVPFGHPIGDAATGDLDVAYVEARALRRRISLRFGRQLIVGGAARLTQIDGARIDWSIWRGVGLTVYGGAPVTPRFGLSRGDAAVGGRLFYRPRYGSEVGFSFIQLNGLGRIARQDVAVDGRWEPTRALSLTGYADFSTAAARLAEATVAASWQPVAWAQLAADYRRTAPELFLPLNSIFSVFAQSTRDEVGGTAYARLFRRVRLYGDYHAIIEDDGTGQRAGVKATIGLGEGAHATLGSELRVLHLPTDGYVEARLFALERLPAGFLLTVDGDAYRLEREINAQNFSFTGAGTVGWDFAASWRLVLTGIVDVTPFVQQRFELLARLVYNHTYRFHEVTR